MPDFQETIDTMGEAIQKADLSIQKILYTALIAAVGVIVIRLLMMGIDRMLRRTRLDANVKGILRGSVKFVLGFVLSLIVLGYLNVEVTSLVALLSVAALAVSLALQSLLSNVAGGLLLLSTKPYTIGDYIEVGEVAGTVLETGMFYTKLRTYDGKAVHVPNSQVSSEKIINYTAEATRRVDVKISISCGEPVEKVKAAMFSVLRTHPKILADPEPEVRLNGFGERSIEYFIRVWCANADYWDVYFDVMEGVKAALDRAGIEMAYHHVNVHMIEGGKEK